MTKEEISERIFVGVTPHGYDMNIDPVKLAELLAEIINKE